MDYRNNKTKELSVKKVKRNPSFDVDTFNFIRAFGKDMDGIENDIKGIYEQTDSQKAATEAISARVEELEDRVVCERDPIRHGMTEVFCLAQHGPSASLIGYG